MSTSTSSTQKTSASSNPASNPHVAPNHKKQPNLEHEERFHSIQLQHLRTEATEELHNVFGKISGRKALVLDKELEKLITHIVPESTAILKANAVVHLVKEGLNGSLNLRNPQGKLVEVDSIVYMVRPTIDNMKEIVRQIQEKVSAEELNNTGNLSTRSRGAAVNQNKSLEYNILAIPNYTYMCKKIINLAGENISSMVNWYNCCLDLFPLEIDLLSLELPLAYRGVYLEGDTGSLISSASVLYKLQRLYGTFPEIIAKGDKAKMVLDRYRKMKEEVNLRQSVKNDSDGSSSGAPNAGGGEEDPSGEDNHDQNNLQQRLNDDSDRSIFDNLDYNTKNIKVNLMKDAKMASNVEKVIILDRETDLVTPLVTPLTYEGTLDELFNIKYGWTSIEKGILLGGRGRNETKESVAFNSNDSLFHQIRDVHIEAIGNKLKSYGLDLQEMEKSYRGDKSFEEINAFVKQIPEFHMKKGNYTLHLNIMAEIDKKCKESRAFKDEWEYERRLLEGDYSSSLDEYIDDLIADEAPITKVLKLLCLQSLTCGGIKQGRLDFLRREIVHTYGYDLMFGLYNLEKMNIIMKAGFNLLSSSTTYPWKAIRTRLQLIQENVDSERPHDISYVTSGYAPLSVRLIEQSKYWNTYNDILKVTDSFERQGLPPSQQQNTTESSSSSSSSSSSPSTSSTIQNIQLEGSGKKDEKILVVMYIGGITMLEIASLRFLSRSDAFPYKILIVTTGVLNGSTLVSSLLENMTKVPLVED